MRPFTWKVCTQSPSLSTMSLHSGASSRLLLLPVNLVQLSTLHRYLHIPMKSLSSGPQWCSSFNPAPTWGSQEPDNFGAFFSFLIQTAYPSVLHRSASWPCVYNSPLPRCIPHFNGQERVKRQVLFPWPSPTFFKQMCNQQIFKQQSEQANKIFMPSITHEVFRAYLIQYTHQQNPFVLHFSVYK